MRPRTGPKYSVRWNGDPGATPGSEQAKGSSDDDVVDAEIVDEGH